MNSVLLLLPEIVLALTFCSVLFASVFYRGERVRFEFWICLFGLLAAAIQAFLSFHLGLSSLFYNSLSFDGLTFFSRIVSICLAIGGMVVVHFSPKKDKALETESFLLILAMALSCSILSFSGDLLLSWLGWIILSVSAISLQAFNKKGRLSIESGIKSWFLFFFSILFFSIFILFFAVHFQSTNIFLIHQKLAVNGFSYQTNLIVFMLFFGFVGLAMGLLPSLQVSPDMMEGAPTASGGLIQAFLRLGALILFLRIGLTVFSQPDLSAGKMQVFGKFNWTEWCNLIAAVSFAVSALLAARQTSLKRILGYLLVSESAFLMIGISVQDFGGVSAAFYQFVLMSLSLFGVTFVLDQLEEQTGGDSVESFRTSWMGRGFERVALIIFLLTLAGIPPFPGFLSKFIFLSQTLQHGNYLLSATAVFATLLNGITVLKVSQAVFAEGVTQDEIAAVRPKSDLPHHRKLILVVLALPIVVLGVFTEFVLNWLNESLHYILW